MAKIFASVKLCIVAFIVLMLTAGVHAQHTVHLEIPSYCQEQNTWCGAGTGQMILQGYPSGVKHAYPQITIWHTIQKYNDDSQANWAAEPNGLQGALMTLGNDPGVHWMVSKNTNPQSLMYEITYWMTKNRFPTAVLVNGLQHWVVINKIITDVDPTTHNNVTLQQIEIVNPYNPPCPTATWGGTPSVVNGSDWYDSYWSAAGNIPGSKWNGNFIAVIMEPPPASSTAEAAKGVEEKMARTPLEIAQGRAVAPKTIKERREVITPQEAAETVEKNLNAFIGEDRPKFTALRDMKPLQAMLVNQDRKSYYLSPLPDRREDGTHLGAVLVNAYKPEIEEVGIFPKQIKYLTADRAITIALQFLNLSEKEQKAQTRLMFQPSTQTQSRFFPLWEVTAAERTVYVNQDGNSFDKLTTLPAGD